MGVLEIYVLLASEVLLITSRLVVEVACIFDGDFVALLRLVRLVARGDDLACDTHVDG